MIPFTGGRGTRFVRLRNEDDSTLTFQAGGKFDFGGAKLATEGTWSKAIKKDPLRSEFQFRTGSNAIAGTVDLSDFLFQVDPTAGANRAYDPSLYTARQVNYDRRRAAETLVQVRSDLEIPVSVGDGSTIKIGAKYLSRDKVNNRDYQQLDLNGFTAATAGIGIDEGTTIYGARFKLGPRIDYDTAQAYITANPARAVLNVAGSLGNSLVNDYIVDEDVYAGYAMATLHFGPLTLIPGARVEHTKGAYQGKTIVPTSTVAQGLQRRRIEQLHQRLPGPQRPLRRHRRAGDSRGRDHRDRPPQLRRPRALRPGRYRRQHGDRGQSRPQALALEECQTSASNIICRARAAVGRGLLQAYRRPRSSRSGRTGVAGTFGGVALTNAVVTQPINASSSEVYGVEVALQLPLAFLPAPLDGLGVNLNYTRTGGSTAGVPGRAGSVPNYLQSRDVASAQVYYEKGPGGAARRLFVPLAPARHGGHQTRRPTSSPIRTASSTRARAWRWSSRRWCSSRPRT